ncbi:chromosome segregation protein SMC [Paenibacillus sp. TRM 82003]|uniref:chromosome segregation protein SMC n=1 Tax=Kineococcus sp. TRM81007 TaxID=2925831 RepID=UPI001F598F9C|nr:chromosome segregation protein SMC [Kineococcus sp. TRM81007]MCI2240216.1 chromosome segregation protein SMC [Kineococcus sp. TRM81007]MCI3927606.1 chromosome segregation protein SMC [Paenibacillus sp. TRM 82003]
MHLKTLTLKGFKSFASATTLRLEPGITCVVGPNGSGKSNVVDALTWVMGEHSAKSLRGGKMEDVIFAGTTGPSGRAALGRAEVSLTIDNTDGALPIEYAEVTITRTMFRTGGSEYAINGSQCRLLDVQELLSDSGIGREMHVVVGQGQIDAVLHASPEERRAFVEEAAGVLKHRRRKEKALRKLDAMEGNLTRVADLVSEIRRQLKPLGRQAEAARRAQVVQADLRDARLRLLADDLVQAVSSLQREEADEAALRARQERVEADLREATERLRAAEAAAAAAAPDLARAVDTHHRLQALAERLRGARALAAERLRLLAAEPEEQTGRRDPEELTASAARVRAEEEELTGKVAEHRAALDDVLARRAEADRAAAEEDRRVAAALRAAADRREGLARLGGQVAAARSRVEAAEAELERLSGALADAERRRERAQGEFAALETQVAGVEEGEEDLDAEHEEAAAALEAADAACEAARAEEGAAAQERAGWAARKEALELGLTRGDGAGALLAAGPALSGVLGSVAALLEVETGWEQAVAAALGAAADAVAVAGPEEAAAAIEHLRAEDAGRAGMVLAGAPAVAHAAADAPDGARPALALLKAPAELSGALSRLLGDVVVVDDLAAARALVAARPDLVAATRDGDVLSAHRAAGGSASAPSLLQVQAAADEAADALAAAEHRLQRAQFTLTAAQHAREQAADRVEAALERLHENDARMNAVAEQLAQLGAAVRAAAAEAERAAATRTQVAQRLEADRAQLTELGERFEAASAAPEDDDAGTSTDERDRLTEHARSLGRAETEARLALRTTEERARALAGRADALERQAAEELRARERAAARRARRAEQARVAGRVREGAERALARWETSAAEASRLRQAAEAARARFEEEVGTARRAVEALTAEQHRLGDSRHADEVARAQQRWRIDALRTRAIEELGTDPDVLVAEFGPDQLVPPSPPAPGDAEPDEPPQPRPYVRAEQDKRRRAAERALAQLGTVNPLALEEFAAMEERHAFLVAQSEDLKKSRKDLLDIVKEVDERVERVFSEAFADVAAQFEEVFPRLFPGGEGRLVLTDPSDMLATGIEVEARPAGKKVKRLSLLSGGERSLAAVAMLVAIFRARPSPFYVLDEVEAALDDANLSRLITLFEELRASSQLIVITHQKRTMQIADALYGVTMRGDGISTVVSQRLREAVPA